MLWLRSVDAPRLESEPIVPGALGEERRPRILLVDDHDDTRMIMSRILGMRGFDIVEAACVGEALAKYESEAFDLVISDLGLPDGSGHELMENIQSIRPVKGIALSGYGMEEDITRSHAAGFHRHLVKPVEIAKLDAIIRETLAGP